MRDNIQYWVELSDYDLETAEALFQSQRFLYVGFMCHQSIEKILKAYFIHRTNDTAPYSHSLSFIAKKGGYYSDFNNTQKNFIDQLEPLNIETRYPLNKERLLKSLDQVTCKQLLSKTRELQSWIKKKL